MMERCKIFDATLRDGGYYTDWDFDNETIDAYIKAMNALPIDYLELGYRNNPSKEYLGKYGYCPVNVLRHIRAILDCSKLFNVEKMTNRVINDIKELYK